MDQLTAFFVAPHGRRLLVHGSRANTAVRDAAATANVRLIEINARETPLEDLLLQLEALANAKKRAVVFISSIDAFRGTRADWRIRGTTQLARHLGLVMVARFKKTLLWLTSPAGGFYKQLNVQRAKRLTLAPRKLARSRTHRRKINR